MRMRRVFAADGDTGSGEPQALSIESAVAKLGEQRAEIAKVEEKKRKEPANATAKPERETARQDPVKEVPEVKPEVKPEASAETGDLGTAGEPSAEVLAAALEQEPTTAADSEMPPGWGEADRATWQGLTPEAQAKLVTREKQREAGIRKQLQPVEAERKAVAAEREALKAERQKLGPALQSTQQMILQQIVSEFPDVDPRDPNSMMRFALEHPERKVVFDEKWKQLGAVIHQQKQIEAQQKANEEAEHGKFAEARVARLLELDASLSDPVKSSAFETAVVGYLMKDNPYGAVDPERIKHYSAEELLMVEDARKYRKAISALKKTPPANVPKVVKPGAGSDGGKSDEVAALEKRHKKGGSIDTGLALLRARRAQA